MTHRAPDSHEAPGSPSDHARRTAKSWWRPLQLSRVGSVGAAANRKPAPMAEDLSDTDPQGAAHRHFLKRLRESGL